MVWAEAPLTPGELLTSMVPLVVLRRWSQPAKGLAVEPSRRLAASAAPVVSRPVGATQGPAALVAVFELDALISCVPVSAGVKPSWWVLSVAPGLESLIARLTLLRAPAWATGTRRRTARPAAPKIVAIAKYIRAAPDMLRISCLSHMYLRAQRLDNRVTVHIIVMRVKLWRASPAGSFHCHPRTAQRPPTGSFPAPTAIRNIDRARVSHYNGPWLLTKLINKRFRYWRTV